MSADRTEPAEQDRGTASGLSSRTDALLTRLAEVTELTRDEVLEFAVTRYGFVLLGGDGPVDLPGNAFRKIGSDRAATVGLRQKDDSRFFLVEPFRYLQDGRVRLVPHAEPINPHTEVTDLASVPSLLTWLVPRYGRHSLPALLHDDLQPQIGGPDGLTSRAADDIFRRAMEDTRVPFFRRWIIWSAVSARTRWRTGYRWRGLIIGWFVLFGVLAGIGLPAGAVLGAPGPVLGAGLAVALLAPWPLSLLWVWERRAGVVAAYTLMGIALPLVFVGAASLVYVLLETVARLWEHGNRVSAPRPRRPAPEPPVPDDRR